MKPEAWSDKQYIRAIRGLDHERDAALRHWFSDLSMRKQVGAYVMRHQGNAQDAEDVYAESLIIFDRLIRNGKFEERASLRTFFLRIARWQWVTMRRKNHRFSAWDDTLENETGQDLEREFLNLEKEQLLEKLLAQLGERCHKVLILYRLHYSMREIAGMTGLSSEEMATKTAHECRGKLRKLIQQQSEWSDLLRHEP